MSRDDEINALIAHLDTFPIAERIVASGKVRLPMPLDDNGRKRFRQSLGGAYAIGKIGYYTHSLREVDARRFHLGKECHARREAIPRLMELDPVQGIRLDAELTMLSGLQEVTFHYFAICVAAIDGLLPEAARAAGYKVPKPDKDVLHSYVPLRDYFEHMENRLPGKSYASEVVVEFDENGVWRVKSGFQIDGLGRILLKGKAIDVTSRGLAAVEDAIGRSYEAMRLSVLEQVRDHFARSTDDIPAPDQVPYEPLLSTFSA